MGHGHPKNFEQGCSEVAKHNHSATIEGREAQRQSQYRPGIKPPAKERYV